MPLALPLVAFEALTLAAVQLLLRLRHLSMVARRRLSRWHTRRIRRLSTV